MATDMGSVLEARAQSHPERPLFSFYDRDGTRTGSLHIRIVLRTRQLRGRRLAAERLEAGRARPSRASAGSRDGGRLLRRDPGRGSAGDGPAAVAVLAEGDLDAARPHRPQCRRDAGAVDVGLRRARSPPRNTAPATISPSCSSLEWIATDRAGRPSRCFQAVALRGAVHPVHVGIDERAARRRGHPANAIHNGRLCLPPDPQIGVSWLPHYHDMGLLGYYIYCIVNGGTSHLFAPIDFLRRPALWFALISRVGATMTTAPNGAYDYCLREDKLPEEQLQGIDLSSLRVMVNCAEPVRAKHFRTLLAALLALRPEKERAGRRLWARRAYDCASPMAVRESSQGHDHDTDAEKQRFVSWRPAAAAVCALPASLDRHRARIPTSFGGRHAARRVDRATRHGLLAVRAARTDMGDHGSGSHRGQAPRPPRPAVLSSGNLFLVIRGSVMLRMCLIVTNLCACSVCWASPPSVSAASWGSWCFSLGNYISHVRQWWEQRSLSVAIGIACEATRFVKTSVLIDTAARHSHA